MLGFLDPKKFSFSESVVSGHQVGILGGPLFVIYKILGVIKLAEEKKLSAVFWLEGNDTDFDEIKTFSYIDSGQLKKFTWKKKSEGIGIGSIEVDDELFVFIRRYLKQMSVTDHHHELEEVVLESFKIGSSLLEANFKFLSWLFSDFKLHFFNPQQKEFIQFSQPRLHRELIKTPVGEQANGFVLADRKRIAIFREKNGWVTRGGKEVDLKQATLVPNLKMRSLLQDEYLNARYYIAGPGEEVYLNRLRSQYEYHHVHPAEVIPRMKAVLVLPEEVSRVKVLNSDQLSLKRLSTQPFLTSKKQFLSEKGIDLDVFRQDLFDFKNQLVRDRTITSDQESDLYHKIKHLIGFKRSSVNRCYRQEMDHLRQVSNQLYPCFEDPSRGNRQERVFNIVSYLNRYGKSLIQKIYREYEFEEKTIFL